MAGLILRAVLSILALSGVAACAARVDPATIADAQTAARVKSALVNDPDVGIYPIEVNVTRGVARLSGRVPSEALAARAVELARAIQGVVDVRSELRIGGDIAPDPPPVPEIPELDPVFREPDLGGALQNRFLAVGGVAGWTGATGSRLDGRESFGPVVRFGAGRGLGISIGFGWFGADLAAENDGADVEIVGRVRIRPVMGGVGYTVRDGRVSMTLSAVGGMSFNSIAPADELSGREVPLRVRNSLAWGSGVSFWVDASSRVAVNVSTGFVMARPEYQMFDGANVVRRRLTADAVLVRVGLAYKVF